MFNGKLEPGDRAVFTNESPEYAERTGQRCTVRTVDSHTTVVLFDDGSRMCVYPGELTPLRLTAAAMVAPYGGKPVVGDPYETIGRFQYPLTDPERIAADEVRYYATEDEGSLA